ncbi:MAG: DnaJ domain-containing protein [Planctomycetia bacterium]|nr:MAG: DnaJ domain-containing protein [Planctomycetia bacterium]
MEIIILAIIGGLAGFAWDWWRRKRVAVRWGKGTKVRLLPQESLAAAIRFFEQRGFKVFPGLEGTVGAGFSRGNWSLPRVSGASCIDWQEVPLVVGLGIAGRDGSSEVHAILSSPPGIRFSAAAARFFIEQASGEFKRLVACLEAEERKRSEPSGAGATANGHHRHRWMPEDDAGAGKQARRHDASHDADLALLGLDRGATLEQVKKAYRIASRKYHPDGLTGRNVEPHLVELAVQRFKEVSAAYQRLCEHFAQTQHA